MALIDTMGVAITSPYLDSDVNWKQYVTDHRIYIKNNSRSVLTTAEVLVRNRNNIRRWLRSLQFSTSVWWIVLLINDIDSDMDFDVSLAGRTIYVPSDSLMTQLYQNYLTTSGTRVTDPVGE